ncbi:MAG TPA: MFS transporter [Alphaproteobacteria bacterium]|nr:MFS transporter [Alphaproteobacteria bacterium]
MAADGAVIDIPSFINERKLGRFQLWVVLICGFTVLLDGYDAQSIAFVAPSIAKEWHLDKFTLGPVFTASLVGLLVGALLFGVVADKIGRRKVILICTAIFGVFTLLTATSDNLTQLLIYRLLTGFGLGGAMPNCIALTAEYCPERRRATLVMIMFTGFSFGAAAAGAIAAHAIPTHGWRVVWYVGGILPLITLPLQFAALPESIRFLMVTNAARERIASLVRRIDPRLALAADARFTIGETNITGVPVAHLFRNARGAGTVLLWIIFFMNLLDLFFLQNWIPAITTGAGVPVQTAVIIGTLFQIGGIVASFLIGMPMDRYGAFRVLPLMFGLGCVFVIVLGHAGTDVPVLMLLTFGAGFCVIGGQNCANALSAIFYPTAMRSTGVGWCLGIGRVGAIVGPLVAAFLISLKWPTASIFLLGGLPLALACVAIVIMSRTYAEEENLQGKPATKVV